MKSPLNIPNAQADFFIKSYLILNILPYLAMNLWIRLFYILGKDFWEHRGEGTWLYAIWALYTGYLVYIIFVFFSCFFILIFNNKLMSGKKINKKTKFALFLLSIFFYVLTLVIVSFVYSLF